MTRRLAVSFGASALLALTASPTWAQSVPTETEPQVTSEVETLVEDPLEKVKKVVRETAETAETTAEEAQQEVEETVTTVDQAVDEALEGEGGGNEEPATPTTPAAPTTTTGPPTTGDPQEQSTNTTGNDQTDVKSARLRREEPSRSVGARGTEADATPVRQEAPTEYAAGVSLRVPALAEPSITPGEAAQRLAFPILMIVGVVLFLLVQGRVDRGDPKLVFDTGLDGDSLSFE